MTDLLVARLSTRPHELCHPKPESNMDTKALLVAFQPGIEGSPPPVLLAVSPLLLHDVRKYSKRRKLLSSLHPSLPLEDHEPPARQASSLVASRPDHA